MTAYSLDGLLSRFGTSPLFHVRFSVLLLDLNTDQGGGTLPSQRNPVLPLNVPASPVLASVLLPLSLLLKSNHSLQVGEKLSCELKFPRLHSLASERSLCCVGLSFGFTITCLNLNGRREPSLLRQRAPARLGPEHVHRTDLATVCRGRWSLPGGRVEGAPPAAAPPTQPRAWPVLLSPHPDGAQHSDSLRQAAGRAVRRDPQQHVERGRPGLLTGAGCPGCQDLACRKLSL